MTTQGGGFSGTDAVGGTLASTLALSECRTAWSTRIVIYWVQDSTGHDVPDGQVHHAAIVTSVVDGDIKYTAHSVDQIDASLGGRTPINDLLDGNQKIVIIRPDPWWMAK